MKFSDKYAPKTRDDLVGKSQLKTYDVLIEKTPQITLLTGDSGVGKTTLARLYSAHLLECDVDELKDKFEYRYNNSRSMGVGDIRKLTADFVYKPINNTVYIFDEIDQLTKEGQKHLNEFTENSKLPEGIYFIFCTLNPDSSNFQRDFRDRLSPHFRLSVPTPKEQKLRMVDIFKAEGVEIEDSYVLENSVKTITKLEANDVFESADGSIRVLMDKIQSLVDGYFVKNLTVEDLETLNLLLAGETNMVKLFKSVKDVSNFNSFCDNICREIVNNITYGKLWANSPEYPNARKVLKIFGMGLPDTTSPKISFHKLLSDFCD